MSTSSSDDPEAWPEEIEALKEYQEHPEKWETVDAILFLEELAKIIEEMETINEP